MQLYLKNQKQLNKGSQLPFPLNATTPCPKKVKNTPTLRNFSIISLLLFNHTTN